jgi:hypothetical protein
MARTASWILLGIMMMMLAGCGRTPTAPEGSGKKTPAPVHTRTVVSGIR